MPPFFVLPRCCRLLPGRAFAAIRHARHAPYAARRRRPLMHIMRHRYMLSLRYADKARRVAPDADSSPREQVVQMFDAAAMSDRRHAAPTPSSCVSTSPPVKRLFTQMRPLRVIRRGRERRRHARHAMPDVCRAPLICARDSAAAARTARRYQRCRKDVYACSMPLIASRAR